MQQRCSLSLWEMLWALEEPKDMNLMDYVCVSYIPENLSKLTI
jgi:hypothetical protein